jgi:hypothetical protein
MRPVGTHLLGRRLYQTMTHWDGPLEGYPPEHCDFARVWQKAEQIVFSRTLTRPPTRIGRVEREFDPEAAQARIAARHLHWRRRTGSTCARIRSRRRVSPVSPSGDRRRRKAGIPNRHTTESRIARYAAFRHRSNPLALSLPGAIRKACLPGRLSPRAGFCLHHGLASAFTPRTRCSLGSVPRPLTLSRADRVPPTEQNLTQQGRVECLSQIIAGRAGVATGNARSNLGARRTLPADMVH